MLNTPAWRALGFGIGSGELGSLQRVREEELEEEKGHAELHGRARALAGRHGSEEALTIVLLKSESHIKSFPPVNKGTFMTYPLASRGSSNVVAAKVILWVKRPA